MKLILHTYLLQIRRKCTDLLSKHAVIALVLGIALFILLASSSLILKASLITVLEIINDIEDLADLVYVFSSLAFASSAIVIVLAILRIIIAEDQDNTYFKMLRNYDVSSIQIETLRFMIQVFYLFTMGLLINLMVFLPSLLELKQYRLNIALILILQCLFAALFVESALRLIHILLRFLFKRWISVGVLCASLYYAYTNLEIIHPLNLWGYLYTDNFSVILVISILLLIGLLIYTLSFSEPYDKHPQTYIIGRLIPDTIWFKHLKETIRLKDFWFNSLLIFGIMFLIAGFKNELFSDPVVIQMFILVPSMHAIYGYSQIKDSINLYRSTKISILIIYLSTLISWMIIYSMHLIIIYLFVPDIKSEFAYQFALLCLLASAFKLVGLLFPLNYKDSQQQQIIISSISLLIIPCVLIGMEVKKYFNMDQWGMTLIYLVGTIICILLELWSLRKLMHDIKN